MDSNLTVRITAQDGASAVFAKVGNSAKSMGQSIEQVGKSSSGMQTLAQNVEALEPALTGVGLGLTAIGGAGLAAFGAAAGASVKFSAGMANVNSIARLTADEMSSLEASVLGMATQFGAMPSDLTAGLYDIVSSGFEASEALDVLEASVIAAGAGMTSTATSSRAISAVLNAYKLDASEAGNVSDVLFKTIEGGVITFEMLANNMGSVLPVASSLGIEIDELGAAYADLTLKGIGVSQAETGIANIMRAALNPTTELTDAVREYGFASAEALLEAEGFAGFLAFLDEAAGGSKSTMLDLVGTQEALTAAMALSEDGAAGYIATLGEMGAAQQDGAYSAEVFGIQMDTTAGKLQILKANLATAAIGLGSALDPLAGKAADVANRVVTAFNSLSPAMQGMIGQAGAFGSAMALASGGLLLMAPRIAATVTAINALRSALALVGVRGALVGLTGLAINPLTVGLTAATIAGVGLYRVFQNIQENASGVAKSVGMLTAEIERLKLAAQPETADQLQSILDSINQQKDLLSGDMADLIANGVVPPGTDFLQITTPGGLSDQVAEAGSLMDEFSAHITKTVNSIADPQAKQAYLDWVNDLMAGVEHSVEGTNLDEIINQVLITPASEVPGVMDEITSANEGAAQSAEEQAAAMAQQAAEADALAQSMQELLDRLLAVAGVDDPLSQWDMMGTASEFAQMANNAVDAGTALETIFRVTVGNTNAIADQTRGVANWIDELVGAQGEWAAIDDLSRQGRISADQYNAALEAQGRINAANYHIQWDVRALQAAQAPLIAEHTEALEAQMHAISNMPAQQQLVALGWMDTVTAGRAMEFQTLAVAVAAGELGAAGEGAFTAMITGAAQADPVLKALLVEMGLITEHPDETFTVNLEGADAAMSDMDQLTLSILNLNALMSGQTAYEIAVEIYGKEEADKLFGDLAAEDGKTRTTTIQANVQVGDGTGGAGGTGEDMETILRRHFPEHAVRLDVPVEVTPSVTMAGGPNAGDGTGGAGGRTVTDIVRDAFGEDVIPVEPEVEVKPRYRAAIAASHVQRVLYDAMAGMGEGVRVEPEVSVDPVFTVASDVIGAAQSVLDAAFSGLGGGGGGGGGYEVQAYMTINATDNASPVINAAKGALDAANGAVASMQTLATDGATPVINAARSALAATSGASATVFVNGTNSAALAAVSGARGALNGISGAVASTFIHGDESDATGAVSNAQGALNGVDGNTASISVLGENSGAMGAIGEVAAYDGALLATSYIDIVTRNYSLNIGGLGDTPFAHGGVVGYAHGGTIPGIKRFAGGGLVPFWAGENGPEIAHFAAGGTHLIDHEGLYAAPPMTYISPNNAVSTSYGGNTYNFNMYGTVIGMDDFEEQFMGKMSEAIAVADARHRRGLGVS